MAIAHSKFEILQEEISKMAEKTGSRSINNKLKSFRIYLGIAVSSALITFLVAIGSDVPENMQLPLKIITLLFSGLSTVLAAWDGFYNHKQLWINYGDTRGQLHSLLLKMKLINENDRDKTKVLDELYYDYQDILHKGNMKWKEIRIEEKENS